MRVTGFFDEKNRYRYKNACGESSASVQLNLYQKIIDTIKIIKGITHTAHIAPLMQSMITEVTLTPTLCALSAAMLVNIPTPDADSAQNPRIGATTIHINEYAIVPNALPMLPPGELSSGIASISSNIDTESEINPTTQRKANIVTHIAHINAVNCFPVTRAPPRTYFLSILSTSLNIRSKLARSRYSSGV